jgi:DNA-binding transcriptional MerR regulator
VIKKWKQRQQLAKWLKDHGKNLEDINSLLEQWGKGEQGSFSPSAGCTVSPSTPDIYVPAKQAVTSSISSGTPTSGAERLPHCDMDSWYLRDVGRDAAEELLMGKRTGTFLIRPSSDGQHALSIICAGRVGHCRIIQVQLLSG